jgi:hypothetical protein
VPVRATSSTLVRPAATIDDASLTEELACQVMGWRATPDRFIKSGRSWIPKWRFAPFTRLEDAFRLLEASASSYTLRASSRGVFTAEVSVASRTGWASGQSKATIITVAVARAIGLDVPDGVVK